MKNQRLTSVSSAWFCIVIGRKFFGGLHFESSHQKVHERPEVSAAPTYLSPNTWVQ